MKARLVPCSACQRHVRVGSATCPFCGADASALNDEGARLVGSARLGSLAVMTFRATALGVALNACGGEATNPKPAGTGGSTAQGGATGSGGTPSDNGSGGSIIVSGGRDQGAGGMDVNIGGQVPIYRATPRG